MANDDDAPVGSISSYLHRPLRTLEAAQRDRERAIGRSARSRAGPAAEQVSVTPSDRSDPSQHPRPTDAGDGLTNGQSNPLRPLRRWIRWRR